MGGSYALLIYPNINQNSFIFRGKRSRLLYLIQKIMSLSYSFVILRFCYFTVYTNVFPKQTLNNSFYVLLLLIKKKSIYLYVWKSEEIFSLRLLEKFIKKYLNNEEKTFLSTHSGKKCRRISFFILNFTLSPISKTQTTEKVQRGREIIITIIIQFSFHLK